jgi:type II restriction enzyme
MNLGMPAELGSHYNGPTQKARVITEGWMAQEGYCPACLSHLCPTAVNSRAVDFGCDQCGILFQLKSMKSKIGMRVPDGAYETMLSAVKSDTSPALLLMRYDHTAWMVRDLIVIPSFALRTRKTISYRIL